VVSDLLRERLGPASTYVESLIAIQRAYINTNHPNFLGAQAAMSTVIQNKQEREKKAAKDEERRKREKRRMKELGGVNGVETLEDEEDVETKGQTLPVRGHATKGSRSLSPAPRGVENGIGGSAATLNGNRSSSPPRFNNQVIGATRDSFLNYFFGKEGGLPSASVGTGSAPPSRMGRHVNVNTEPSFSQSIRRQENRSMDRIAPQSKEDEFEFAMSSREIDFSAPFVSCIRSCVLTLLTLLIGEFGTRTY